MGLGKTLTVISLILTNYHDGRPLAKPNLGFIRQKSEMGRSTKGGKKKQSIINPPVFDNNVGKKLQSNVKRKSAFGFFSNFKSSDEEDAEEEKKTSKFSFGKRKAVAAKRKSFIDDSDSDSSDEFDQMAKVRLFLGLYRISGLFGVRYRPDIRQLIIVIMKLLYIRLLNFICTFQNHV